MTNEFLWIVLLLISYVGIYLSYRLFGKRGLFAWVAMAVIIANVQVLKTIELFGFVTTLGNIIYGSIFLATDILNENHGKKEAQKAVWQGFFILILVTVLMQVSLSFMAHESDSSSEALSQIFGVFLPISIASLTAYLISQLFDVWFYHRIRQFTKEKHLWLRNNLSTMISQLLDNILFTGIFFVGYFLIYEPEGFLGWPIIFSIFISTIAMKYIVAIVDTLVIYYAKRIKKKVT